MCHCPILISSFFRCLFLSLFCVWGGLVRGNVYFCHHAWGCTCPGRRSTSACVLTFHLVWGKVSPVSSLHFILGQLALELSRYSPLSTSHLTPVCWDYQHVLLSHVLLPTKPSLHQGLPTFQGRHLRSISGIALALCPSSHKQLSESLHSHYKS